MKLFVLIFTYLSFGLLKCYGNVLGPGAQLHISQVAINRAVDSFLEQALSEEIRLKFPDNKIKFVYLHEILMFAELNRQHSQIHLLENGSILISVREVKLKLRAETQIKKWFFTDKGKIKVQTKDAKLDLAIGIYNENGRPRLMNQGIKINFGHLKISVEKSIVSWVVQPIFNLFQDKIKREGHDFVVDKINTKINEFSDRIVQIETQKAFKGKLDGFFVDYGLSANPIVENSALTVPIATQFWYKDDKNHAHIHSSNAFPFGAPQRMVCVDLDTNIVYGTIVHAYKASGLNIHLEKRSITLKTLTNGTKVKLEMSVETQKQIYFNGSGIYFLFSGVDPIVYVEKNGTVTPGYNLEYNFGIQLMTNITFDHWTLKGSVDIFKTKLRLNPPWLFDMDMMFLEDMWQRRVKNKIEAEMNEKLASGIPLPSLNFATFHNTYVSFQDHFVRLCADVHFNFNEL